MMPETWYDPSRVGAPLVLVILFSALVLFFISPPNVYREDTTIDTKTVEAFLNFRFQPIQVVTPSGEFKNLAPYPPYHLPK